MEAKCDVCGKDLVHKGVLCAAFNAGLDDPGLGDIALRAFLNECVKPYELGKAYLICHGCVLKALGVKEEE